MTKRRTRKEKERARNEFALSWQPGTPVKGQIGNTLKSKTSNLKAKENTRLSAKDNQYEPIRRDLIKSLILASLILGLEAVIYLAWH